MLRTLGNVRHPGALAPQSDPPPIKGTDGDDHLRGLDSDSDDHMSGLGGNDILEGLGGEDVLNGGAGNDTLIGGDGHDELNGGSGNDVLNGLGGTVEVFTMPDDGKDRPTEFIDGGAGTDTLIMDYRNWTYQGLPGQPIGITVDMTSGTGVAKVVLIPGHATVSAESFTNMEILNFDGPDGDDRVTGGARADRIDGNGGNDILKGAGGDDFMSDSTGRVNMDGGAGFDSLALNRSEDTHDVVIHAAAGTITVGGVDMGTFKNFEYFSIAGGSGDDTIQGASGHANYLFGGNGNDTLTGGKLADSLEGGAGRDVLTGGAGDDTIDGGTGNDAISGGAGNDTITDFGSSGDTITGGTGDDTIEIDLTKAKGAASFDGGSGRDTLFAGIGTAATVDFTKLHFQNFEILDDGFGNFGPGFTARFTTAQFAQFDTIFYRGETIALADRAAVALSGDMEFHVLQLANGGQTVDCTGLTAFVHPEISGGTGDDVVTGMSANAAALFADLGAGNDTYKGKGAASNISGGSGNDTLTGGSASDRLSGDGGADHLTPGGGVDTLAYAAVSDSTGAKFDTVTGFDFTADKFDMPAPVTKIDKAVTKGDLSKASFDHDLAHAIGSAKLGAHDAVLFTANGGGLSGKMFLIVDANGHAGYQAGEDFVIRLDHATHTGQIDIADFT